MNQNSNNPHAPSYKELVAQRESLEQQIAQARKQEVGTAVSKIQELISEFGLTNDEIFPAGRSRAASANKGNTVAPKYRDPATGQTWTGRGKAPIWIRDKEREQFLIAA